MKVKGIETEGKKLAGQNTSFKKGLHQNRVGMHEETHMWRGTKRKGINNI